MPVELRLPQFGMAMQDATVNHWYKHEGDEVREGDLLAEIETNKATEDLPSPCSGTLERVLVPAGATANVNDLLAVILAPGEVRAPGAHEEGDAPPDQPPAAAASTPAAIAPRARRLAGELGVELGSVVGTGPSGRITEADVTAAAARRAPGDASASRPITGMRAAIAERMHASLRSSAQLTLVREVDVTTLVTHRDRAPDPRPSYTDLLVRAAALALRRHPRVNASIEGDEIREHAEINIGVAVTLEDGLLVPVVRNADRRSLAEISTEVRELARRVRAGEHGIADVTGGTFTITSLGSRGIDAFTPIINAPEAAILGVGRIIDRPARDGDALVWRKAITLSLTIDHRILDGAPGAEFLQTLAELLEDPWGLESAPI